MRNGQSVRVRDGDNFRRLARWLLDSRPLVGDAAERRDQSPRGMDLAGKRGPWPLGRRTAADLVDVYGSFHFEVEAYALARRPRVPSDAQEDGRSVAVNPLVGLIIEGWAELDRVLDGLDAATAVQQVDGGSSFAWTLAHVTNQLDTWVNVRLANLPPDPVFDDPRWRFGGSGVADNWDEIKGAVVRVRANARTYLEPLDDAGLAATAPYAGALAELKGKPVTTRYTLLRIAAHVYFHIGEIAAVRSRRLGHQVGDYPGPLLGCL